MWMVVLSLWNDLIFIGVEKHLKTASQIRWGEIPTKAVRKIELLESVRKSDNCRSTGSVDRQRSEIWPLGDIGRPPGRPKLPESTAECSVDRSGRPTCTCTVCARRSTGTVDRLLSVLKNQNLQKPEIGVFGFLSRFEVLDLVKLRVWAYVTTLTS